MSQYRTSLDIQDYFILQDTDDYAFSQDSVFLVNLAKLDKNDNVLDLGCGCGVLSMLAVVKKGVHRAVGIELQERISNMAKDSVLQNGLEHKIEIVNGDVKDIRQIVKAESFDKVLCNPPYFDNQQVAVGKEISRHETTATIDDFINASAYALKFGGDAWFSFKAARLATIMNLFVKHNLQPKEIVFVYPKLSKGVDIVIVKARKGAKEGLTTKTLIVQDENDNYTNEYKELYN